MSAILIYFLLTCSCLKVFIVYIYYTFIFVLAIPISTILYFQQFYSCLLWSIAVLTL